MYVVSPKKVFINYTLHLTQEKLLQLHKNKQHPQLNKFLLPTRHLVLLQTNDLLLILKTHSTCE